jgi:hypothetical protein
MTLALAMTALFVHFNIFFSACRPHASWPEWLLSTCDRRWPFVSGDAAGVRRDGLNRSETMLKAVKCHAGCGDLSCAAKRGFVGEIVCRPFGLSKRKAPASVGPGGRGSDGPVNWSAAL